MNVPTRTLAQVLLDLIACEDEEECSWRLAEATDYTELERRLAQTGRRTPRHLIA